MKKHYLHIATIIFTIISIFMLAIPEDKLWIHPIIVLFIVIIIEPILLISSFNSIRKNIKGLNFDNALMFSFIVFLIIVGLFMFSFFMITNF